jgi:hypothetical protein
MARTSSVKARRYSGIPSAIFRTASGSVGLARASLAGGGIEEKIVEL